MIFTISCISVVCLCGRIHIWIFCIYSCIPTRTTAQYSPPQHTGNINTG